MPKGAGAVLQAVWDESGGAHFTVKSIVTGKVTEFSAAVSPAGFRDWVNGMLIQNAMPGLSDDERELLMTGIGPEEWADTFKDEEGL